jgi:hypothetical protein
MTRSTLARITLNCQPIHKADYLSLVDRARQLSYEELFRSKSKTGYPNLHQAVAGLIESGETAWGVPEFERHLFDLLRWWVADGWLIRVQLFSRWLLETAEDAESIRWLSDFAGGEFWDYLNESEFRSHCLGVPEDYLYPLRLNLAIASQLRRDTMQSLRNASGEYRLHQKLEQERGLSS